VAEELPGVGQRSYCVRPEPLRTSAVIGTLAALSFSCGGGGRDSGEREVVSAEPIIVSQPNEGTMFLGLRTVVYEVDDLEKAKEWYSQVLGFEPYFDESFYVGFNVGGFELGLHPVEEDAPLGAGGALAYWGVEDIKAVMARLDELGAPVHSELQDVGEGILVASVIDPFGNLLGIIQNPHFGK
jgi:predicted enzyme related to lactoylglutathione lyase